MNSTQVSKDFQLNSYFFRINNNSYASNGDKIKGLVAFDK